MAFDTCRKITLSYELRVVEGERTPLVEKTTNDNPLSFVSGLGMMLPDFENNVKDLAAGEHFDFWITAENAYGLVDPKRIIDIPMDAFQDENGNVDPEQVYVGAVLQMISEDGQRFEGKVCEIGESAVKMDFNNKLAGKDLHFIGDVIDNHGAKPNEIQEILGAMSQGCGGCGGNCGGCGGCNGGCCDN